ncbi:Gfo/Idh/MocA family oxidoreductase [Membranihabitans marinus]|uniref:Gfo/Idh/MocA family oxidoreductase n=1 Tax=Membranihabitans marinus TaxID=1227546 RepID=UPI001F00D75E|nr:Gfo/Idh/MocA family oxidoreductase [Membranihabitans marinus]
MIKIGMIGMSPGNAHPYSWSAIINGKYNGEEIAKIGYPAVTDYLDAHREELGIEGSRVTHVWCQDRAISESIAESSGIDHVVDRMEDMIGEIDALILGRDDPENHWAMAKPFIDADIPIFIDKPLASSAEDLASFQAEVDAGKWIMSCSSMRYGVETAQALKEIDELGKIEMVVAVGKKDWTKYGVHMLEAVVTILGDPTPVSVESFGEDRKSIVKIVFDTGVVATLHLVMDISGTFQVSLFGQKDFRRYEMKDSYSMFRNNLEVFVDSLKAGKPLLEFDKTHAIVKSIIAGIESQESGQKIVF